MKTYKLLSANGISLTGGLLQVLHKGTQLIQETPDLVFQVLMHRAGERKSIRIGVLTKHGFTASAYGGASGSKKLLKS